MVIAGCGVLLFVCFWWICDKVSSRFVRLSGKRCGRRRELKVNRDRMPMRTETSDLSCRAQVREVEGYAYEEVEVERGEVGESEVRL